MGRQPSHKKSKKQQKSKKKKGAENSSNKKEPPSSWVDRLVWVPAAAPSVIEDAQAAAAAAAAAASESSCPREENTSSRLPSTNHQQPVSLSVITWNVLAEAYCSRRSHPRLPTPFQRRVFDPAQRRDRIISALHCLIDKNRPDVLCLQEVDLPEIINAALQARGYELAVETPRVVGGGSGGRTDACAVYIKRRQTQRTEPSTPTITINQEDGGQDLNKDDTSKAGEWEVVEHQIVRFDDLASLSSSNNNNNNNNSNNNNHTSIRSTSTVGTEQPRDSNSGDEDDDEENEAAAAAAASVVPEAEAFAGNNLQGIQRSLLRRNMGLLVRLRHVADPKRTVVLANVHLYWNPGFEYVKVRT